MLFQRLTDAKNSREPEHVMVQGDQHLSKEMSHDGVAKVVKPVVLVGRSEEWVLGPEVDGEI